MAEALTDDHLLGGRVALRQPADGYRVAIDPVLLAASIPVQAGERVIDVGAGVGAAALCVAARAPKAILVGLDCNRSLVGLATHNAQANGVADRVQFYISDLRSLPIRLSFATFDHVMTNPPYLEDGSGHAPTNAQKAEATIEGTMPLADWLQFCVKMARPKGTVTVIHRTDRFADVLAALDGRVGELVVCPLWPGGAGDAAAKRVLVRGRKGVTGPLRLVPGLVLHDRGGAFTAAADAILRQGAALTW